MKKGVTKKVVAKSNYGRLTETKPFDIEKARELASLHTEMEQIQGRLSYLGEIANRNRSLNEFLWRTIDGRYLVITDIEDDHLRNIVKYLLERGSKIPFNIRAEYTKRFGETIKEPTRKQSFGGNLLGAGRWTEAIDDDESW